MVHVNYLFMGNPGSGKSTLINCLLGQKVFHAGLSFGGGLTEFFQKYPEEPLQDGVVYMDTPGLADRKLQEQAAKAITMALKQSGQYKLFFLVRLENGRVVADDLATVEVVMNSIAMENVPFSVIVNSVKKRQYETLMNQGEEYREVVAMINGATEHATPQILFIPMIDELEEQDNAIVELPESVKEFIEEEAISVDIQRNAVKEISAEDFRALVQEISRQLEELRNDNAALRRRITEMEEQGFFNHSGKAVDSWVKSVFKVFKKKK